MAPYLGKWKSAVVLPPMVDPISLCTTTHRVYQHLLSSGEWVDDIHAADVIFVSAHSQGSIVSTHLVDRLIRDGHVTTSALTTEATRQTSNTTVESVDGVWVSASEHSAKGRQRICCLSLCGVHLGPLRYLKMSSYIQPYIQVGDIHPAQCLFLWLKTFPTSISKTLPPRKYSSFRYVLQGHVNLKKTRPRNSGFSLLFLV